jgi:SNF2 family DNA or RNA helicase
VHLYHINWSPDLNPSESGHLVLWAEDGNAPLPAMIANTQAVVLHPFCADAKALCDWLESNRLAKRGQLWRKYSLQLWLPSTHSYPLPSPQLVHNWEELEPKAAELRKYEVRGLELSAPMALALLMGYEDIPCEHYIHRVSYGASFAYWQKAAWLALEILAAQRFVPTLRSEHREEQFAGRWLPVMDTTHEIRRFNQLAAAMPPVCRAEAQEPQEAYSASVLLGGFISWLTDGLIRAWAEIHTPRVQRCRDQGVAYQWFRGLISTKDHYLSCTTAQAKHFAKSYNYWIRNLELAGDSHFRIAFRLHSPENTEKIGVSANWPLEFMLQARADPSVLVSAAELWQNHNHIQELGLHWHQPKQKLLGGLGFAAQYFAPIKKVLMDAQPQSVDLDLQEAYEFLCEAMPILEESGFGVIVPRWWHRSSARVGLRIKIKADNAGNYDKLPALDMNYILGFQWQVVLGDTPLTEEDFRSLVALKSPLVEVHGQWVHLDARQIEAVLRFWQSQNNQGECTLRDAIQWGSNGEQQIDGIDVQSVEFDDLLNTWMERFTQHSRLEPLPPPESLQADMRPYQLQGYAWLDFMRRYGMGACLADDMGLGKTLQTIALLLRDKESGVCELPSLVICPTSVIHNWNREIKRFAPDLSSYLYYGVDRPDAQGLLHKAEQVDVVLTSFAILRRDIDSLSMVHWHCVVIDEAQNIKNHHTQQFRAIQQLGSNFRIALTGTPVENRLADLWSIMHFLNPGYLGSRRDFGKYYAMPIERYGDEKAQLKLKQVVGPFFLRRVKTDPSVIRDLPEKLENKEYCTLSSEQAALYRAVLDNTLRKIDNSQGIRRKGMILGLLTKLKQVCNHPALFLRERDLCSITPLDANTPERSGKLNRLIEMLELALDTRDHVLLFTQFAEMGHLLKERLQYHFGIPVLFLHGGTPTAKREQMIHAFQEDQYTYPIFVLSLKAGGTGLNLTRANRVFHYDRWWNPAVENQATDRAFRIGQTRNILVHKFVCVGTLEERIDAMIEDKKSLASSIIGHGEKWLTELSSEDLRNLVSLRLDSEQLVSDENLKPKQLKHTPWEWQQPK